MRRQYHFRPSKKGLYAWDVYHLIGLSKDIEPKHILLDSIAELKQDYWFGGEGDIPTCMAVADHAKLIAQTDLKYPVILSSDGRVMDGMHRVCKAYIEGKETIRVVQFTVDPKPDFVDVQDPDTLPYD